MKLKFLMLMALCGCGLHSFAAPSELKISLIDCQATKDGRSLLLPSLSTKASLNGPVTQGKPLCKKIQSQGRDFVEVTYDSQEIVSYSNRTRRLTRLEIYQWINGDLKLLVSEPLNQLKALWTMENRHLLLRLQDKDKRGREIFLNGYVFDPSRNKFVDYQVFAKKHGWTYKE